MPRVHAPELEDFDWYPAALRDATTDILRLSMLALRLHHAAAAVISEVLVATRATRIVDLCSGGGGPVLGLQRALEERHGHAVVVVLTDKFPNHDAFARAEAERPGRVVARREPIDATALPEGLHGVRTLFNALHHFRPDAARAILADAVRRRQPIATFEIVERSAQGFLSVAAAPLAAAALMPFCGPRTPGRLALTYLVPVLPLATAWDGFASCLRSYSHAELRALVEGLGDEGYGFRLETRRLPGSPMRMTALVGVPLAP